MDSALTLGAFFSASLLVLIILASYFYISLKRREREVLHEREEATRRLYELAILKELGERIGYSLNVEEVMGLITGSLHQFINYTVVSYAVILEEKVRINTHVEASVSRAFLDDMNRRMLASLEALTSKAAGSYALEEKLSGAIVIDELKSGIGSLFNIPLVVSGAVVGVLTIVNTQSGLYKEADMTILYKIVGQASTAVTKLQAVVTSEEEKLIKVREEFTSMMVHELRSPLDGIKKMIELMISGSVLPDSKEYKEYLTLAYQSSSSLLELVNDILDLSKLQAGKFEVNKEPASLKEVIDNRALFYRISAESRKLSLETYLDANLPERAQFDPQAVKQVLNNFISNALKFTSEGGHVLISAFPYDGSFLPGVDETRYAAFPSREVIKVTKPSLCVIVTDTGIGIKSEDLANLFRTYQQAKISPVRQDEKGTGLGLVIAKGIVEAHGGIVGAFSREGLGSSFFFTIPLSE